MSNNRHFCFVCFPPTVALLPNFSLSKNCLNIENSAAHKPGFLHTDIYVHVAICPGVIRQDFRQIYKSLLEPTFEGSFKMRPDKCLCHRSLCIYKCWVSGFSFFWCCPQLHGTSGHQHVRCHSSGQIWFVKLGGRGFLWRVSNSSTGESQHFSNMFKA